MTRSIQTDLRHKAIDQLSTVIHEVTAEVMSSCRHSNPENLPLMSAVQSLYSIVRIFEDMKFMKDHPYHPGMMKSLTGWLGRLNTMQYSDIVTLRKIMMDLVHSHDLEDVIPLSWIDDSLPLDNSGETELPLSLTVSPLSAAFMSLVDPQDSRLHPKNDKYLMFLLEEIIKQDEQWLKLTSPCSEDDVQQFHLWLTRQLRDGGISPGVAHVLFNSNVMETYQVSDIIMGLDTDELRLRAVKIVYHSLLQLPRRAINQNELYSVLRTEGTNFLPTGVISLMVMGTEVTGEVDVDIEDIEKTVAMLNSLTQWGDRSRMIDGAPRSSMEITAH